MVHGMGIAASAVDLLLLDGQQVIDGPADRRLFSGPDQPGRLVVELLRLPVALCQDCGPYDQGIDPVPQKGQGQGGIGPQVLIKAVQGEKLRPLGGSICHLVCLSGGGHLPVLRRSPGHAFFHLTPSRVSSRMIPFALSSSRMASAFAKSRALRAACRAAIWAST